MCMHRQCVRHVYILDRGDGLGHALPYVRRAIETDSVAKFVEQLSVAFHAIQRFERPLERLCDSVAIDERSLALGPDAAWNDHVRAFEQRRGPQIVNDEETDVLEGLVMVLRDPLLRISAGEIDKSRPYPNERS